MTRRFNQDKGGIYMKPLRGYSGDGEWQSVRRFARGLYDLFPRPDRPCWVGSDRV